MSLYDNIIEKFPELEGTDAFANGTIILQNDADDSGDYIAAWNYDQPLPKGMKIGK